MSKTYRNIDQFLDETQSNELQRFFEKQVLWEFGSQSDRWKIPFGHWNHDFLNSDPRNQVDMEQVLINDPRLSLISEIWAKIKKEQLPGHKLVRCYTNAHTYGVEGYPHVDHRSPGNYTTLIYVNPYWTVDWAGETVLVNEIGDIIHSSIPKPGRVLIFDGRITHASRSVSRRCPALRITLMFKSYAPNEQITPPPLLIEFLTNSKTHLIPHSEDYSLLDHLVGTYKLLKEFNAIEEVCLAALFHSVYGTHCFTDININQDRRSEIRSLIGERAEALVWMFCNLKRPSLFEAILGGKTTLNQAGILENDFNDLLLLESANILDQKALDRFPKITEYAIKIGLLNEKGI